MKLLMKTSMACLVITLLAGCATHRADQVQVEDRSINTAEPAPVDPTLSGARSYPTVQQQAVVSPPATKPQEPDKPQSPATNVPPASQQSTPQAQTHEPSGALLALLEQAEQQHQRGQNQQALSSLERAQRIAPHEPLVYLQLARLRKAMQDAPRAEQLARKGLSLSAGNPKMQQAFRDFLQQLGR